MSSINDLISRASNGIINMDAPKRAPQPKQLTQRQMQVNEILRTGGKRLARISQLRREVATRSNRSWLQRTKEDTLDANTPEDRLARMQKGLPEMYKDEQEQVYNRRTIGDNFNAFDQIAGPVTQWTNTISARALEVPETLRGQVASMTNNEKALNASVKRQEDLRNRLYSGGGGWFNKGTIFDSPEEAKSPDSRHVWRGLGGTVDAASFGLGGSLRKAGVQLYRQGAKQSAKNLATRQGQRELSKMAGSGALGTVGFDLATNRDVSPGSVITSGITGAVGGVGIGVGAPLQIGRAHV